MHESNSSHAKVDLTLRFFHLGSTLPSVSTTSGPFLQEDGSSYQVIRNYTVSPNDFALDVLKVLAQQVSR